jgi:hypothetical protein
MADWPVPSIALGKHFKVIAANEFVFFRQCAVDYDDVDVVEGHELLFNRPLKLICSDADALSLIECHGHMLSVAEL